MRYRVERQQKLHCDDCHEEVVIEGITPDLIGTPCPRCHSSMLTETDYRAWKRMEWRFRLSALFYRGLCALGMIHSGGLLNRTAIKDGEVIVKLRKGGLL